MFRRVNNDSDKQHLQNDLDKLVKRSEKWKMLLNFGKCKCLHIGHGNLDVNYKMGDTIYIYIYICMYININSKGPNTDPCGTPLKTDLQFETSPSTTTRCLLYNYIISTGDDDPLSIHLVISSKNITCFVKHDLAFRNPG